MTDTKRKRRGSGAALVAAFVLALALFPSVAFAHAKMTRSEPKNNDRLTDAPKLVELWFNEELEPGFTTIEVTDPQGKRVDRGEVTLADEGKKAQVDLEDLTRGTYTVVWKALSTDEHTIKGKFTFTVTATAAKSSTQSSPSPGAQAGAPAATPAGQSSDTMAMEEQQAGQSMITWGDSFVRWLSYLAMMMLFGGFAFRLFVFGPALRRASAEDDETSQSVLRVGNRRALLLFWSSAVLLVIASIVALVFQAAAVFDKPLAEALSPTLWREVLTRTGYGPSWLLQASAAVVLLVLVFILSQSIKLNPKGRHTGWWWAGLVVSALLLLAPSWTGHAAAAAKDYRLAIASDWLHLIAGGFWVGGLFHFALSGLPALRRMEKERRSRALHHIIARFTQIAFPSVALLALAGLYNTWVHIGSWAAFWETPYGRTLLLKLALVLLMLLLGAVNNFHFGKKTKHAAGAGEASTDSETAGLERGFTRSVRLEAVLGVVVLLVTAALVFTTPPRKHPAPARTESSMSISK